MLIGMSGERRNTSACMACTGSATINTKCQEEFGPEWVRVGDTGCGSCRFNGLVIGRRGTCKHSSYQGNTLSCCLGNGPRNSRTSCDPNWSINTGGCDNAMAIHCAMGSNAVNDVKCKEWRSARPAQANAISINTIRSNPDLLADPDTQLFAKSLANSGDPSLDSAVYNFCSRNPDNKLCTCINSKALTDLGINPKCVDAKCLETGYLTANQVSTDCPDIISCTQINNLKQSGLSLVSSIKTNQSCGNETDTTTEEKPVNINMLLFVIIFLVIIALGLSYSIFFNNSPSELIN